MTTLNASITGSNITGANVAISLTISDADLQTLINAYQVILAGSLPANPTVPQVLAAFARQKLAIEPPHEIQNHGIATTIPPPISIT